MRTAQLLKHVAFLTALAGVVVCGVSDWPWGMRVIGVVGCLIGGLTLRLLANIGQLVYDIKASLVDARLAEGAVRIEEIADHLRSYLRSRLAQRSETTPGTASLEELLERLEQLKHTLSQR